MMMIIGSPFGIGVGVLFAIGGISRPVPALPVGLNVGTGIGSALGATGWASGSPPGRSPGVALAMRFGVAALPGPSSGLIAVGPTLGIDVFGTIGLIPVTSAGLPEGAVAAVLAGAPTISGTFRLP